MKQPYKYLGIQKFCGLLIINILFIVNSCSYHQLRKNMMKDNNFEDEKENYINIDDHIKIEDFSGYKFKDKTDNDRSAIYLIKLVSNVREIMQNKDDLFEYPRYKSHDIYNRLVIEKKSINNKQRMALLKILNEDKQDQKKNLRYQKLLYYKLAYEVNNSIEIFKKEFMKKDHEYETSKNKLENEHEFYIIELKHKNEILLRKERMKFISIKSNIEKEKNQIEFQYKLKIKEIELNYNKNQFKNWEEYQKKKIKIEKLYKKEFSKKDRKIKEAEDYLNNIVQGFKNKINEAERSYKDKINNYTNRYEEKLYEMRAKYQNAKNDNSIRTQRHQIEIDKLTNKYESKIQNMIKESYFEKLNNEKILNFFLNEGNEMRKKIKYYENKINRMKNIIEDRREDWDLEKLRNRKIFRYFKKSEGKEMRGKLEYYEKRIKDMEYIIELSIEEMREIIFVKRKKILDVQYLISNKSSLYMIITQPSESRGEK